MSRRILYFLSAILILVGVGIFLLHQKQKTDEAADSTEESRMDSIMTVVVNSFNADSAYMFCARQCAFGARVMNTSAHDACGDYIVEQFRRFGLTVTEQKCQLTAFDGTSLEGRNIIASTNPEAEHRVLICAHWDSRPWADNDPIPTNRTQPVMGANDGASGVAVMLELARVMGAENQEQGTANPRFKIQTLMPESFGIDFICLDAEDYGIENDDESWALGAQYWAAHPHKEGYKADFGILLDMVGGVGSHFYRELFSEHYASWLVDKVWECASLIGNGAYFLNMQGGGVTDDHKPINDIAGIPTIDIIAYYPDCPQSSFGPTWHTVSDTMDAIDRNVMKAVGETLIAVLLRQAAQYAPSPDLQGR